ncbi:MAG: glutathione S-transferase family protein [Gammaproteobacteria bacterium]|nr:glutathione S-transferase family protein [Gammaproteobacteria bacterium]
MYTLYWSPGTASLCVHWMLIELGKPHELVKVDIEAGEHRKPEYLKLNPGGVIPTLIVDGAPLSEAAALCMILAERHPEAGFAVPIGDAQRAAYVSWLFFLSNTLQTAYHNWFHPDQPAGQAAVEAVKAFARRRIEACLERMDRQIARSGSYLFADRVTAADFVTTMLMRWARNMPKPATEWPAIAAYVKRMKARPSFRTLYEREGLTEWA